MFELLLCVVLSPVIPLCLLESREKVSDLLELPLLLLFLHLEKTGGVSLRSSLQASQRQRRAGRLCLSCASPLSRAQASQCQFFGYQLYWTTIFRIERFLHNLSDYKRIPHARWESSHAHSETTACIEVRPP